LRRTWHHPTPAPPDSTIPRVCTTTPTIPSRYQHNPPPKAAKRPSNLCHPPTARRSPLPCVQCGPRAHLAKRRTRPMAPPAYGRPGRNRRYAALPASSQTQHGTSGGREGRQGRPVTTHCTSWRRSPMTTQATTTYDERFPAVTKPTAATGCKAHRPWTPERAATATPNGR
jgi:hypothetical protein